MEFFNALTMDLKVVIAAIVVFALLGLFAGNHKSEKRYYILVAVLAAGAVFRYTTMPGVEQAQKTPPAWTEEPVVVTVPAERKPIESTAR